MCWWLSRAVKCTFSSPNLDFHPVFLVNDTVSKSHRSWIESWESIPWWAINRIYWMKYSTRMRMNHEAPPADWLTCVACSIVAFMHMYQSLPVGESCPCSFSSWAASSPQAPQTRVLFILKLSLKASGNQLEETLSTSSHYLWACVLCAVILFINLTPPEFSMFLLDLLTSSTSVL